MKRTFRSRVAQIGAGYAIGVGVIAGLSTIASFTAGHWPVGVGVLLGAVLLVLYGCLVLSRVGVVVDDRGFVLRGATGSRFVPRAAVERFEIGRSYPWRVWLVTRDGARLKTTGLGASGIKHRASVASSQELVDELNRIVATSSGT